MLALESLRTHCTFPKTTSVASRVRRLPVQASPQMSILHEAHPILLGPCFTTLSTVMPKTGSENPQARRPRGIWAPFAHRRSHVNHKTPPSGEVPAIACSSYTFRSHESNDCGRSRTISPTPEPERTRIYLCQPCYGDTVAATETALRTRTSKNNGKQQGVNNGLDQNARVSQYQPIRV